MSKAAARREALAPRVTTAVVAATVVVVAVLALKTIFVAAAFGLVVLVAAWEWAGLMGWTAVRARAAYAAATLVVLAFAYAGLEHALALDAMLAAAMGWWLLALVWVIRNERGGGRWPLRSAWARVVAGWLVLVPAWAALVAVHGDPRRGPAFVLILMVSIWCADIGAYFAGKQWGAARLAPRISPGKTWEGAAGGFLAAACAGGVLGGWIGSFALAVVCVATVPASVLGDLLESLCKRHRGVKDSGDLLPGHGGVLDRIDSLTAAAPLFLVGLKWLEVTV